MGKFKNQRGQSLVELAIVLPCFCLGILMGVQLICYCHNMIELQRMAQVTIDRVTYENYKARKPYGFFHALWGNQVLPTSHFSTSLSRSWKAAQGVSVIKTSGRIFGVEVRTRLQKAIAQAYLEPEVPSES